MRTQKKARKNNALAKLFSCCCAHAHCCVNAAHVAVTRLARIRTTRMDGAGVNVLGIGDARAGWGNSGIYCRVVAGRYPGCDSGTARGGAGDYYVYYQHAISAHSGVLAGSTGAGGFAAFAYQAGAGALGEWHGGAGT